MLAWSLYAPPSADNTLSHTIAPEECLNEDTNVSNTTA